MYCKILGYWLGVARTTQIAATNSCRRFLDFHSILTYLHCISFRTLFLWTVAWSHRSFVRHDLGIFIACSISRLRLLRI